MMAVGAALRPGRAVARRAGRSGRRPRPAPPRPSSITRNSSSPSCQWRCDDQAPGFSTTWLAPKSVRPVAGARRRYQRPCDLLVERRRIAGAVDLLDRVQDRPWAWPRSFARRAVNVRSTPSRLRTQLINCPSVTPARGEVFDVLEAALTPLGFNVHRWVMGEPPDGPTENMVAIRGARRAALRLRRPSRRRPAGRRLERRPVRRARSRTACWSAAAPTT